MDGVRRYLSADDGGFLELTAEIYDGQDRNTATAILNLLSRIDDKKMLPFMENRVDTATEKSEVQAATASSNDGNNYLETVLSYTVTYIEGCFLSPYSYISISLL